MRALRLVTFFAAAALAVGGVTIFMPLIAYREPVSVLPHTAVKIEAPPPEETFVWEAEPSFGEAPAAAPAPPLGPRATALNNEAVALGHAGRFADAVRLLREALQHEAGHPILLRNLQASLFNWGVSELNAGDVEGAIDRLEESLHAGVSVEALKLLGSAYLHAGRAQEAAAVLEEASALAPDNAQVLVLLAQGYVELDRRLEALELVFRARDAGAPETVVGPLIARLGREVDAEWDFGERETEHFHIRFADEELPGTVDVVADALERAYRVVGGKLGVHPPERTPVVLYARQDFHSLTRTSAWAEGVFDGRIKIPVRGLSGGEPDLDRVVRHEYAHAVVAHLGGRRVPAWINEGIAMWAEEETDGDRLEWAQSTVAQSGAAPLRHLEPSFARLSSDQARLAYAQSYLAVRSLIARYGAARIRRLLEEIGRRRPLETAFFEVYRIDLERFEQEVFGLAGVQVVE